MNFQANPDAPPFLAAAALAVLLAWTGRRHRSAPGSDAFVGLMLGVAGWAAFEGFELLVADLPVKRALFAMRVISSATAIQCLWALATTVAGPPALRSRGVFWATAAPHVVLAALATTNPWHHLYWAGFRNSEIEPFLVAIPDYGPGFRLHLIYSYGQTAAVLAILGRSALLRVGFERRQAALLFLAVVGCWGVNAADLGQVAGFIHVDTIALALPGIGLAYLPTLRKYPTAGIRPEVLAAAEELTDDLLITVDGRGRVVGLNPAARRLLGWAWAGDRAIGEEFGRVFADWPALPPRLPRPGWPAPLLFEIAGPRTIPGLVFRGKLRLLGRDGRAGCLFVLRDVTDHRRYERERARRRDADSARERAESANLAKDDFLGTLSHELRTPLTPALAALVDLIQDDQTPAEIREVLQVARRGIALEARLIDDLLDLTRIVRGKLRVVPAVLDAHAIVQEALRVCKADLDAAGARVEVELAADGFHVEADAARLLQVIWNLLKNAAKFTPRGGRVSVSTAIEPDRADGKPAWTLRVSDDGVGIAPDFLLRIFEPFAQEESDGGPRRGGLGLGLAISRALILAQGGRLYASSPGPGLGSTFTVTLPLAPAPVAGPGEAPPEEHHEPPDRVAVLLVDDDADTRWVLGRLLAKWGCEVRAAGDVRSAIELADAGPFDILLTDLGLPDGSGHDLLRALELRVSRPFAAVALTGYGRDDDLRRSRDRGFAEHLIKPVEPAALRAAILRHSEAVVRG